MNTLRGCGPTWENVLAQGIGLLIALALAWFAPHVVDSVKSRADPTDGIRDGQKSQWALWQQATASQHTSMSGRLLGVLETVLFFGGLWTGTEIVVCGWLAFKIAAKWEAWNYVVSPATVAPFPEDELRSLWARHQWGVRLLRRFLIGTLYNILAAGAGVFAGRLVLSLGMH